MAQRQDRYPADFLLRSFRDHYWIAIIATHAFMVAMLPLIERLWFVDVFILNLLHATDLFFAHKDWKKSCKDLCFGLVYLFATRGGNIFFTLLCGSAVTTFWVGTDRMHGCPCINWIFFPCILIWAGQLLHERFSELIVSAIVFQSAVTFTLNYRKSFADSLIVFAFMCMHLVFVRPEYNVQYVTIAYVLTFAWMLVKT